MATKLPDIQITTNQFTKEVNELYALINQAYISQRDFCIKLAELCDKVINAGYMWSRWSDQNLKNPRTGQKWTQGAIRYYLRLGRMTDEAYENFRHKRTAYSDKRSIKATTNKPVDQQVQIIMNLWLSISAEAQRIFLDQVTTRQVRRRAA